MSPTSGARSSCAAWSFASRARHPTRTQTRLVYRLEEFVEREKLGFVLTDVGVILSRNPATVDPTSRTATVYRSRDEIRIVTDRETLDGADVLPGLELRLEDALP